MTSTASATLVIARPPAEVWAAIADVTQMGRWSPECIAGRWVAPATGPSVGAKFEGDNEARVGKRVVKRWTTTSTVTACEPGVVFEFDTEDYTVWRYEFAAEGDGTSVTESFRYTPKGVRGFVYEYVLARKRMMRKGMEATLRRVKQGLESAS